MSNPESERQAQAPGVALRRPSRSYIYSSARFGLDLALEAAPVEAWLVVYAAAQIKDVRLTAAPFWLILAILTLFALARRWTQRFGPVVVLIGAIGAAIISTLALARVSPLAYGGSQLPAFDFYWVGQLVTGVVSGASTLNVLVVFVVISAYLGWRGLLLGGGEASFATVLRRFTLGLTAIVLAVFGSLASGSTSSAAVHGTLFALLTLEGFAGLAHAALSRTHAEHAPSDVEMPGAEQTLRWQVGGILTALGIVGCVALLGSVVDLAMAKAAMAWLPPIGQALNAALSWATQGLAYILYIVFVQLLAWLLPIVHTNPPKLIQHPPQGVGGHHSQPSVPATYMAIATVVVSIMLAVVLVILLYIAIRALLRSVNRPDPDLDEERESLEAASLLKAQMRRLLDRLRRSGGPSTRDLPRGSVRWLYRELLRSSETAGMGRHASETPDEYALRLSGAIPSDERHDLNDVSAAAPGDISTLTAAYNDARYGSIAEYSAAPPMVRGAARRVTQALARVRVKPDEVRN